MSKAIITSSIAEVRTQPDQRSELFSQAIHGDEIDVLSSERNWHSCRLFDGSQGWIHRGFVKEICSLISDADHKKLMISKGLMTTLRHSKHNNSMPLLVLPDGVNLKVIDGGEGWILVKTAAGIEGWIEESSLSPIGNYKNFTGNDFLKEAERFIGLPYIWGGTSSFGFDCSGLVQFSARKFGILLPRNSSQQAVTDFSSIAPSGLQAGDLLFFSEGKNVDHVGIYAGDERILHASMSRGCVGYECCDLNSTENRLARIFHIAIRLQQ